MNEVLIAILGFAGTLSGSLFGILAAQKLTVHRVAQLEKETGDHAQALRNIGSRTISLEGRMDKAEDDIRDLKLYHKPKPN